MRARSSSSEGGAASRGGPAGRPTPVRAYNRACLVLLAAASCATAARGAAPASDNAAGGEVGPQVQRRVGAKGKVPGKAAGGVALEREHMDFLPARLHLLGDQIQRGKQRGVLDVERDRALHAVGQHDGLPGLPLHPADDLRDRPVAHVERDEVGAGAPRGVREPAGGEHRQAGDEEQLPLHDGASVAHRSHPDTRE